MTFRLHSRGVSPQAKFIEKDSATVLSKKNFITIDVDGKAIAADATSAQLAYLLADAVAGDTKAYVVSDYSHVYFTGEGDVAFDPTMKGTEVDLAIVSGVQKIDLGASTTDVFKVIASEDAGVTGETEDVKITLNKPIAL
jgi:hypothetical protein